MASQSASDSATTGVGSTSALGIREIIQTTRNNEIWKDFNMDLEFEDDGFATRSLDWFHESFQGLYNMYYSQYGTNQTQSTSGGGSSSGVSRDPYARLLHGLTPTKKKKSRGDPTMSSEYEQYLKTDFVTGLQPKDFASYDVLGFWKSKENHFLFYPAWPWIVTFRNF
ncbi:hypothetical protein Tco_1095793, partial [Tanacetum coccineum]